MVKINKLITAHQSDMTLVLSDIDRYPLAVIGASPGEDIYPKLLMAIADDSGVDEDFIEIFSESILDGFTIMKLSKYVRLVAKFLNVGVGEVAETSYKLTIVFNY